MTDPDHEASASDPPEATGAAATRVSGIDPAAEDFWLRESQRVAQLGTYTFNVAADSWESTRMLDEIFGIDGSHPRTAAGWLAIVHPEDRDEMARYLQEHVLGEGERFDRVYRVLRPSDLQQRWVHGQGELITDEGSGQTSLIGTIQDITERVETDEELRESHELLTSVMSAASEVIFVKDLDGKYIFVNDAVCQALQRSRDEILGSPASDVFNAAEAEEIAATDHLVKGSGSALVYDETVTLPDGKEHIFLSTKGPLKDTDGRITGLFGVSRDVTQERAAVAALRTEEAKFRALFESAADAIIVVGPDHMIRMANPCADTQFGFSPGQLIGRPLSVLIPEGLVDVHANLEAAFLADPRQRPMGLGLSLDALRRDGSSFPAEISLGHIDTDEGVMTMATITDITERTRAEEALLNQEAEHRANVAKTEFLSRMSHELRTPLNAILGFAQLLELEQLGKPNDESVVQILNAGHHLLELVDDVLDISRIEASSLAGTSRPVSVMVSVDAAAHLMTPVASEHGVSLVIDLDAFPRVSVSAEPRRLRQVLLNLLSNAIKYNRPGGTVTVGVSEQGARVLMEISDTGVGISPENLDRIWEPFSRITDDDRYVQGHGLGLSVTRTLTEAMGGRVDVTSEVGQGSSFIVDLPRALDPPEAQREDDVGAAPEPERVVLYVEDNRDNVRLVERVLGLRPHLELVVAGTGEEGLSLADEVLPSVILLDLTLPDINGYECLRRLKESPATQDIPVIVISGVSDADTIARVRSAGAVSYLTKPVDVHQLLDLLDELTMTDPAAAPEG